MKIHPSTIILLTLVLFLFTASFAAQSDADITYYNYQNGLYSLALDDDGIWCGSEGGIFWLDFNDEKLESVIKGRYYFGFDKIQTMTVDKSGVLWLKTVHDQDRVMKYDGANLWRMTGDMFAKTTNCMFTDRSGVVWVGTNGYGVYKCDGDSVTVYLPNNGLKRINGIASGDDGTVWCSSSEGVWRYDGTWKQYTAADGLPEEKTTCITIDHEGIVWVGTYNGLFSYDGSSWRQYDTSDGLLSTRIYVLTVDTAGNIWAGTFGGAARFDGTTFTSYTAAKELIDDRVTDIAVDDDGTVWLCFKYARRGVASFDGTEWLWHTTWNTDIPSNEIVCTAAGGGALWFGYNGGIIQYDNDTWTSYTVDDGLASADVTDLYVNGDGTLLIGYAGSARAGITSYDGNSWQTYTSADGYPADMYNAFATDNNGALWLAYSDGLSRLSDSSWKRYPENDRLISSTVYDAAEGTDGVMWFGTDDGLSRFDGSKWYTYTEEDGLPGERIIDVATATSGDVWCLTKSGEIIRFDGQSFLPPLTDKGRTVIATHMETDNSDNLWFVNGIRYLGHDTVSFGSDDKAVYRYDNTGVTEFLPGDAVTGSLVYTQMKIDEKGVMWFASNTGLVRFDGGVFTVFTADGPYGNPGRDIAVDSHNNIWLVSDYGISRYDGTSWRKWTSWDFTNNEQIVARSIAVDQDNVVWVFTNIMGSEIMSYSDGTWVKHTDENILMSSFIMDIAVDRNNVKWFSSRRIGVCSFDGKTWRSFATGEGPQTREITEIFVDSKNTKWFLTDNLGIIGYDDETWTHYKTGNGFFSNMIIGIAEDSLGRLWFASGDNGVAVLDGDDLTVYGIADGLTSNIVYSIAVDRNDTVWIVDNNGVMSFDGSEWQEHEIPNDSPVPIPLMSILRIDRYYTVWQINWNYAASYDGTSWELYKFENDLLLNTEYVAVVGYDNSLWVLKNGNLMKITGKRNTTARSSGKIRLIGNRPNPFNSMTAIEFDLPTWGAVQADIYNMLGQKVREIAPVSYPVGVNALFWDGTDDSGARVSSGIYFYRLRKGGHEASGRMMFLK